MSTETKQTTPKQKKSLIKRLFKFLLYVFLGIIGLNLTLYILLSIPTVQDKAVEFAVGELKAKLKTEISIEELRLSLFNHVTLKGVFIEDLSQDTLLYAKTLDVSLAPFDLIKSTKLNITGITLDEFVIKVNQKDSTSNFNFQFIVDAFASSDTTTKDSTSSSLLININNINISNGHLEYDIKDKSITPGLFDPSHISVTELNANVDINSLDTENLNIAINHLKAKEKSGFEISNIMGRILSQKSRFYTNGFEIMLPHSTIIIKSAEFDTKSALLALDAENIFINPSDLHPFLSDFKLLKNNIKLKIKASGNLPLISFDELAVDYGDNCSLDAAGSISDITNYNNADINLNLKKLKVAPEDIADLARLGDPKFKLPDILKTLGEIQLKADLNGKLSNFDLDAEAWCKEGALTLNINGNIDSTFNNIKAKGNIRTKSLNLKKMAGDDFGRLSADLAFNFSQNNKNIKVNAKGTINSAKYKDLDLKNIHVDGFYSPQKIGGHIMANLSIGAIRANIEMSQMKMPDIIADIALDSFQINPFYKHEKWDNPRLSLRLKAAVNGLSIDNLRGAVDVDSLKFYDTDFDFEPGLFALNFKREGEAKKELSLKSSIINANMKGQYDFLALSDELNNFLAKCVPDFFSKTKLKEQTKNNFAFDVSIQNSEAIGKILDLPVDVIVPMELTGFVNTVEQKIKLSGDAPHIRFGKTDIYDTRLNAFNLDSIINIFAAANIPMEVGSYNAEFNVGGYNNRLGATLVMYSDSTDISLNGRIDVNSVFTRDENQNLVSTFIIETSDVNIQNIELSFNQSKIVNTNGKTIFDDFGVAINKTRHIDINGIISDKIEDNLDIYINRLQLGEILSAIDIKEIDANINGNISLTNILGQPEFYTNNLEAANIVIFGDTIGTAQIKSEWNNKVNGIRINADLQKGKMKYADVDGIINVDDNLLDLDVIVDRFPINWAYPFVSDIFSKLSGSISSNLKIYGSTNAPEVKGFLGINNAKFRLDYTNVEYAISDTIQIDPKKIGFENLRLIDPNGNIAKLNGKINHTNFLNMKYNINAEFNNLMALNTENRTDSLFFGKAFFSGNVQVNGSEEGIDIDLNIKNEKNSVINIQIPQTSTASDYQSIVYINVPEDKKNKVPENEKASQKNNLPLNLNLNATITQDMELAILIDPKTGDMMHVKGHGNNIKFNYDMAKDAMNAYGEYIISEGSVKMNLQNLSKLDFKIKEGSRVEFAGDPMKTKFAITAYRRVKADLKSLDKDFENERVTNVDVDCILQIDGNMDKMNLSYNISLPSSNEDLQQKVSTFITTDEQKIKQFAFLVMIGTFQSTEANGSTLSTGLWTNIASSTLSAGLNAVFNNIFGKSFEVGTSIDSNDGTLADVNVRVNLSKKFLNDKLRLKTDLGYRTTQTDYGNNFMGDFDIEYLLNNLWTLSAYNHTNNEYYKQAYMTQGIGITYSKEASSIKRLFQSFKPRRRNENNQADSTKTNNDSTNMQLPKMPIIMKEKE